MRLWAGFVAAGAFALAGCNVNVTSNDADTQNAIDDVQQGARDFMNGAENVAEDVGNELGDAGRAAGNAVDSIGDNSGAGDNKAE